MRECAQIHPGLKVLKDGLVINLKYPHLGANPDGVVE